MERIVALCRRRGFIFGSSEIYGGINGFWDYGPLGCELKRNIKEAWWQDMVRNPPSTAGHPKLAGREFQMVGVDCSIIMNPKVWEASGHVGGFQDPMVACRTEGCKGLYRADQLLIMEIQLTPSLQGESVVYKTYHGISNAEAEADCDKILEKLRQKLFSQKPGGPVSTDVGAVDYQRIQDWSKVPCPQCQQKSLTTPRAFNLMFETFTGALQDSSSKVYLRPETAQGIFANFQNVYDTSRVKIPFGIAQIGKAFRNEINPRNYTFRSREFEQMEIEFFCHPDESMLWYEFWRDARVNWYKSLGIASDKLRPRQQGKEELAHYSQACTDIEYMFPFSDEPQELEGVAHRGSFDLNQHGKFAKGREDAFAIFDDEAWERDKHLFESAAHQSRDREGATPARETAGASSSGAGDRAKEAKSKPPYKYVPHVIEPSAGADRFTLAVICEAYSYDESRASPEFLKFHPRLAPIKAAVFPLVAKDGMPEIALPIYEAIRKVFPAQYDAKQSIGKRYARMDEAGTPFCFTIDGQTKEDGTVTVRNRDDASQVRIDKSRCLDYLRDKLGL
ncbi:MAG: glycine--tRNA ligase [Planctomycetota bacterium]|nr:MAG: glycine--tRNA ligase [Planctomycetota bacterium]KAB2944552.1 MAG: glycine--tRNA ligase [Phycisphaerae bacterium]MCQ3919998.1 glycine--tRNA ligase [Planctomycetota bacterium]